MTTPITRFSGEHSFLSNFFPSPIPYEDYTYPTVEHAYQASKSDTEGGRQRIQAAKQPGHAKRLGRKVPLRPDWEDVKVDIMESLLRLKFADPELQYLLKKTGDADLIEGNTWGDAYWGMVKDELGAWQGDNRLGYLLMKLREEFSGE
jgi:ribA/ribD-fused uncharacterized protein